MNSKPAPATAAIPRFAIALSFPGERREFVKEVADLLTTEFGKERILYDKYHEAEFARPDLDIYLPKLYRTESELLVIFLCPEYSTKDWCLLEWRYIRQLIATSDAGRIMFVSFGNPGDLTPIGILRRDGYLDVGDRTAGEIATKIRERFHLNKGERRDGAATKGVTVSSAAGEMFQADISRIDCHAAADLIGRDDELAILDTAWDRARCGQMPRAHVLSFVAFGGEGKTSLVAAWAARLAAHGWRGCEAVFAWSFYSQGAREQTATSADVFLKDALIFFGDSEMAGSTRTAFDKGRRLAELLSDRRAILILDGLEPLQHAPTSQQAGRLKDQGVSTLLRALATHNHGLCVVTTRYSVADLENYRNGTAPETKLPRLSKGAGVKLLESLGVRGVRLEIERLVEDMKGHALTLRLFGMYLRDAHGGDVRRRDRVTLGEANDEQGGHAFHVLSAYLEWIEREVDADDRERGRRAVAALRLMGLFDRPATADCVHALMRPPVIEGLTEALVDVNEAQRNIAFKRLADAFLMVVNRDAGGALISLDTHPLLREYFARQLRNHSPDAWRAAHRRLYEHLCSTTKDKAAPTLDDLQPLYQAIAHGCHAEMHQDACEKVFLKRIQRGADAIGGFYSAKMLGAAGVDLGAVACFFEQPWSRVSPRLTAKAQAWLLNEAALNLRALGRLVEAREPMLTTLEMGIAQDASHRSTAVRAGNLSELELALGDIGAALRHASESVFHADQSGQVEQRVVGRSTLAHARHQAGDPPEAITGYVEAEILQAAKWPGYRLLSSLRGFQYCDLLLAYAEQAAWASSIQLQISGQPTNTKEIDTDNESIALKSCAVVTERAATTLKWNMETKGALLDIALDRLTLGRSALYASCLDPSVHHLQKATVHMAAAVDGLRSAGVQEFLVVGLLSRAWLRVRAGKLEGPDSGTADLDEAWEIAERSRLLLSLADIHLHRARLFNSVKPYPWSAPGINRGPRDDLAEARILIDQCGYGRRKKELEHAEKSAEEW